MVQERRRQPMSLVQSSLRMARRSWIAFVAAGLLVAAAPARPPRHVDTEDVTTVLRRQTQELFDAVTSGDSTVWDRYLAPDVSYADEAGAINSKAELLAGIKPLPKGISGQLVLTGFTVHLHGATAIATYVVDETETYFGQVIHAKYLTTDTWQRTPQGWRLIGAQSNALRGDPPAIRLPLEGLTEYAGTYALTPEITYTIRVEGDSLVGQRTGRAAQSLKAELPDLFFVPGQPRLRKVFQRGSDGRITGFVERRETWDVTWKKLP